MERLLALAISALAVTSTGICQVDFHSWAYQLQNFNIQQIADNSTFQLVVIDYSHNGSDEQAVSAAEIRQLHDSGKTVLSYISIGEAEDYRWYWDTDWSSSPPAWLGPENPEWPGNYKVRFWHPDWQGIVLQYIDKITSAGFDGIYLDIIDAYYYWAEEEGSMPTASSLMIEFVHSIRGHLNSEGYPSFLVFPQNGEFIIEETGVSQAATKQYLEDIDAIGVEDLFFIGDADEDNPFAPDLARIAILQTYQDAGNRVFSIEYLTESSRVHQFLHQAAVNDVVPYVSTRPLDRLFDGYWPRKGDVNLDQWTSILDVVKAIRMILELDSLSTEYETWAADVSSDGSVNVQDLVQMIRLALEDTRGRDQR